MGKLTKNQKLAAQKIEAGKAYSLKEAYIRSGHNGEADDLHGQDASCYDHTRNRRDNQYYSRPDIYF